MEFFAFHFIAKTWGIKSYFIVTYLRYVEHNKNDYMYKNKVSIKQNISDNSGVSFYF